MNDQTILENIFAEKRLPSSELSLQRILTVKLSVVATDNFIFNQVFRRKTLVIKMMNVGGRSDGRASTIRFRGITRQPLEIF